MKKNLLPMFVLAALFVALLLTARQSVAQKIRGHLDSASGWIDVSAALDPHTTPIYGGATGDAPLKITFLKQNAKGDALTLSALSLGSHTGTHIDAPLHFVPGGATLDQVPLERFIGPARVLQVPDDVQAIDSAVLAKLKWRGATRILFRTRSSAQKWMSSPEFHKDFPYLAPDAAKQLVDAGVQLVGIDYLSIEQFGASQPLTHKTLLGKGVVIVEGMDLSSVKAGDYDLLLLPLKLIGTEAGPARALLHAR